MRRIIGPFIITFLVISVLTAVLVNSKEARDVAGEAAWNLFRFFTTPFVLEFTVTVVGLLAVTTFNQWRRSKNGPDWVEMQVPVSESRSSEDEPR